jgi:hypothetical protein
MIRSLRSLKADTAADGIVNMQLTAISSAGAALYAFPRRLVATSAGLALRSNTGTGLAAVAPQTAVLHLLRTRATETQSPASLASCLPVHIFLRTYKKEWTIVGSTYSRFSGVKQDFSYSKGQNSNIGVGDSASGSKGSFTEGGSMGISSNATVTYPEYRSPKSVNYLTEIVPAKYVETCDGIYDVEPYEWAGGAKSQNTKPQKARFCTFYEKRSSFTKDTNTSGTFSTGLTVTEIGFNASAQTGWDTDATIAYHFTNTGMYLCGLRDYPTGRHPNFIVAGR